MEYTSIYNKLQTEVCIIVFLKKDATVRTMLATRNKRIANIYGKYNNIQFEGHDRRCNIENGNIAVYDLIIDEVRSFNIGRLISFTELGTIRSKDELDRIAEHFKEYSEEYSRRNPMELDINMNIGAGGNDSDK